MIPLYVISLVCLALYSYVLIDLNLTLINAPWWLSVREPFIQLGYFQRETSWYYYVLLISILFIFHYFFVKRFEKISLWAVALSVGGILLFSYPLLSHDFFNYIFDAKIFTYYHQNPYQQIPGDYPQDEWIRFMHWTHRSYPYGPVFLVLSIIPSFLAMGKFILNFLFFKGMFVAFYLAAVYYLNKINKKSALEFATHPLVLMEGLVSAHNDLIGVSLAIAGFYYLFHKKEITGRIFMVCSAGIKYITAPFIIVSTDPRSIWNALAFLGQIGLLMYLAVTSAIHPWYFLALFAFLPLYKNIISKCNILLFGLLLSYYPFIRFGQWSTEGMAWKHLIISIFAGLNLLYLVVKSHRDVMNHVSTVKK